MKTKQTNQRMEYYKRTLQEKPIYEAVYGSLDKEEQQNLYGIVCMPVMVEFISWVLEEAQKSGKERFTFWQEMVGKCI